jgi:hypothetical protein
MTPKQLAFEGEAIFGREWQSPMARALAIHHPRHKMSVRLLTQWLSGNVKLPAWVDEAVIKIAQEERNAIETRLSIVNEICKRGIKQPEPNWDWVRKHVGRE